MAQFGANTNPFSAQPAAAVPLFVGAPAAAPSPIVNVPGFFCEVNGAIRPLSAPRPVIPTPADDGIPATPGDDLTAPNAVSAARLNRVVCVGAANVGYSDAAKDTNVLPSGLEYNATICEGTQAGKHALTLRVHLEYTSTFPSEGMVVWLKKHLQFINDEKLSQLVLIETSFEDWIGSRWVSIATDIRYAEEAEAVVQAVITSDSGQTAGKVSTKEFTVDAKLGPVGEKGRMVLTYYCDNLYSYAEMHAGGSASQQRKAHLVPISFQLPWAAIDNPGNQCDLKIHVQAPSGTSLLDHAENIMAYADLQKSLEESAQQSSSNTGGERQSAVIPSAIETAGATAWHFSRATLPPKPMMVLAWLSVPDPDSDWEMVRADLPKVTCATLLQPTPEDERLLRVGFPGNQSCQLYRCIVKTEAPARQPTAMRVHSDIVISDASGSTGMRGRGATGGTVRANFNKHEERRLMKRLEAIPKLCEAGILFPHDVWRTHFVIFDHDVKHEFGFESKIQDLDPVTVAALVKALEPVPDVAATSHLQSSGKQGLLQSLSQVLTQLRAVQPGGATSFVKGAQRAASLYKQQTRLPGNVAYTTFVNFDTDGGNNCGPCFDSITELVKDADVVQGHVMGIGSWVDQDCASKVATILKGSAELAMNFPEDAAADQHFRADLSRWIKVLRSCPISVKCSAGARAWTARHGQRTENAVECMFAAGDGLRFDEPDVTELMYTKSTVRGLMAGEAATLYIASRLPFHELERELAIEVGGTRAAVHSSAETMQGIALGHHWLCLFGVKLPAFFTQNSSSLCARLRNRIEDDLSFSWNLPSTSGSTAALGRAKTENRPPVPKDSQPLEPEIPKIVMEEESMGGGWGFGGKAAGKGRTVAKGGGLFGASPPGGMPGGGLFGAGAPAASFGAPAAAAAPTAPAALFGAPAAAAASFGGGLFGSQKRGGGHGGVFGMPAAPPKQEPASPAALLKASRYMQYGQPEAVMSAASRGVHAIGLLAQYAVQWQNSHAQTVEDPLVAAVLGAPQPAQPSTAAVHHGFTCDASKQAPIVGPRFKSTNTLDTDLIESARRAGNLAGGSGYRIIATRADAMRMALAAIISWWWLLWPDQGDMFGQLTIAHHSVSELANQNEAWLVQSICSITSLPLAQPS